MVEFSTFQLPFSPAEDRLPVGDSQSQHTEQGDPAAGDEQGRCPEQNLNRADDEPGAKSGVTTHKINLRVYCVSSAACLGIGIKQYLCVKVSNCHYSNAVLVKRLDIHFQDKVDRYIDACELVHHVHIT